MKKLLPLVLLLCSLKVPSHAMLKPSATSEGTMSAADKKATPHYWSRVLNKIDFSDLEQVMNDKPQLALIFAQGAAEDIKRVHPFIISEIIDCDPETAKVLTQAAAEKITKIPFRLLEVIMQRDPETAKVFTQVAAEKITDVHENVLAIISYNNPAAHEIFEEARRRKNPDALS